MILESDSGLNPDFKSNDHNNNTIFSVVTVHQALSKAFKYILLFNLYNICIKKILSSFYR